jgi:putative FmdB family regulatory protein
MIPMPIFEYHCGSCGGDFDLLVRSDTSIACPECGSKKLAKKLSSFASFVKQANSAVPACHTGGAGCDLGRCGSGLCGAH